MDDDSPLEKRICANVPVRNYEVSVFGDEAKLFSRIYADVLASKINSSHENYAHGKLLRSISMLRSMEKMRNLIASTHEKWMVFTSIDIALSIFA